MTPFVATIPIDSGAPVWGPIERRADVIVKRTGPRHFIVYARDVHGQRMRHRLVGYLVGIVNAFGPDPGSTYGRPLLGHVPAGWSHDPFAPTGEEP